MTITYIERLEMLSATMHSASDELRDLAEQLEGSKREARSFQSRIYDLEADIERLEADVRDAEYRAAQVEHLVPCRLPRAACDCVRCADAREVATREARAWRSDEEHPEDHDDDCERCLACRVATELERVMR